MHDLTFDHLTRRASLVALGAAGLTQLLTQAPATSAKQSASKKAKKKARKKCQNQVGQCAALVDVACDSGDEDCRTGFLACCQRAGDCDIDGFLLCIANG